MAEIKQLLLWFFQVLFMELHGASNAAPLRTEFILTDRKKAKTAELVVAAVLQGFRAIDTARASSGMMKDFVSHL